MRELLNKLRRYEIHIRKAINTKMHGDFQSVFKGSGLEFSDVRAYQYGDDVRSIDWIVSAKGHGTFVKVFEEEKEQNVVFLLDVSASQQIGVEGKQKIDIAREMTGVLTLAAIKEKGHVGLIAFSDQKELYIQPGKGLKHAYQLIKKVFELQTTSGKTNLNKAMLFGLNLLKRKSIIILISDFIDEGYESHLGALANKHDLVVIHLSDKREYSFPSLGIIPLFDKETQKTIWVNSSSKKFREKIKNTHELKRRELEQFCRSRQANYLWVDTQEDYVPKLVRLFRVRNTH